MFYTSGDLIVNFTHKLEMLINFKLKKCSVGKDLKYAVYRYLPLEAEPKDNNPYKPPGGDYFLSTYKRLGTQADPDELESETHAMLRQVCCVQPVHSHHQPLVNLDTDSMLRSVNLMKIQITSNEVFQQHYIIRLI